MDYGNFINEINRSYPINIKHIELHREMIGKVYFLQSQDKRYTLKIYRSFKTDDALQTIRILDYLKENSYPAVSIIRTEQNESHIILSSQGGCCVGILYDYVEGAMPDGKIEAESIGIQIGELHNLMDKYPDQLKNRPKTEYIDDYISIMRELDFHSGKTRGSNQNEL